MMVLMYIVVYTSAIVFVCACVVRAIGYARAPIHLRWELYPVPHDEPARTVHGGSCFESTDSWSKPRRIHRWPEFGHMLVEMLFLRGLWRFNRRLWYCSFPFHFGLYLLIGTIALSAMGAAIQLLSPGMTVGMIASAMRVLYGITGMAGAILTVLGALGLLLRRLTDEDLKPYTTPGDIFNLVFFLAAVVLLTAGLLAREAESPDLAALFRGLLTFDLSLRIPATLGAGVLLASLLVAYVPFTHMSHFIAKYFTFHKVLWDDAPNPAGGRLEAKLAEHLTYRPRWSAAHMGADGTKTWAQVAADNPALPRKK